MTEKFILLWGLAVVGMLASYSIGHVEGVHAQAVAQRQGRPIPVTITDGRHAPTAALDTTSTSSSLLTPSDGYVRALCYYQGQDGKMYPLAGLK